MLSLMVARLVRCFVETLPHASQPGRSSHSQIYSLTCIYFVYGIVTDMEQRGFGASSSSLLEHCFKLRHFQRWLLFSLSPVHSITLVLLPQLIRRSRSIQTD